MTHVDELMHYFDLFSREDQQGVFGSHPMGDHETSAEFHGGSQTIQSCLEVFNWPNHRPEKPPRRPEEALVGSQPSGNPSGWGGTI